jgi:transcriptional regulator GlxA family with amidase domain
MDKSKLPVHGLSGMPKSPRVIDVLTYPAVQLLDVTGPVQVFASANDLIAGAGGTRPYLLRVVALGGQGVTPSSSPDGY